jgi:hypothetical protein
MLVTQLDGAPGILRRGVRPKDTKERPGACTRTHTHTHPPALTVKATAQSNAAVSLATGCSDE